MLYLKGSCLPMAMILCARWRRMLQEDKEGDEEEDDEEESEGEVEVDEDEDAEVDENRKLRETAERLLCRCRADGWMIYEVVQKTCGETNVGDEDWHVQFEGRKLRSRGTTKSSKVEEGDT